MVDFEKGSHVVFQKLDDSNRNEAPKSKITNFWSVLFDLRAKETIYANFAHIKMYITKFCYGKVVFKIGVRGAFFEKNTF